MKYAPIVIFAFNRLNSLKACVAALQKNTEALDSDLVVWVDGPRPHKHGEKEKVDSVRNYVKTISGFRSVTYHFSEVNKKLGPSIIDGVTQIVNQYGKVIVVEDDLIASRNFLAYMNFGLNQYGQNQEVWSICGFSCKINVPKGYHADAYFCPRSSSWGWATWKNRWLSCDWELKDWDEVVKNGKAFNRWGGSDCFGMLKGWHEGRNQSWAIRFCYNQFVNNALSLFPVVSKIDNEGFDGSGTNCKQYSRYKFDFDTTGNKDFLLPDSMDVNKTLLRQFLWYYSIPLRAYSKLRYIIDDLRMLL
jgi:hypothetical protein